MKGFPYIPLVVAALLCASPPCFAVGADALVPHKALYDVDLVATRSGSQIVNIHGRMFYQWKPACDAWVTDHRFNLFYEYADSPGMWITSDFSTFETFDGKSLDFSSRRKRDGELYQEVRGRADTGEKGGQAIFSLPEPITYDLSPSSLFPMAHTMEMVKRARAGDKFFSAHVFDGSDEEGPIEINTFIGKKAEKSGLPAKSPDIDKTLIEAPAWNIRMAVFPVLKPEETADYEMNLVFHDNGVISDMMIEYDDFSVTQKLVALEKIEGDACGSSAPRKGPAPR